jgi:prefoldin subunit 5
MALLKFHKGTYANLLKQDTVEGNVYITTDEHAMYVDINNKERIRIGQIISITETEWENLQPPFSTESIYYITTINALVKYNGSNWVQLNGTGNLDTRLGTVEEHVTNLLNWKTSHTTEYNTLKDRVTSLEGRMDVAEGDIDDLQDRVGTIEGQYIYTVNVRKGPSGTATEVLKDTSKPNEITLSHLAKPGTQVTLDDLNTGVKEVINAKALASNLEALEEKVGADSFDATNTVAKAISDINSTIGDGYSTTKTIAADIKTVKDTIGFSDFNTTNKTVSKAIKAVDDKVGTGFSGTTLTTKVTNIENAIGGNYNSNSTVHEAITALQQTTENHTKAIGTGFSESNTVSSNITDLKNALNGYTGANAVKTAF